MLYITYLYVIIKSIIYIYAYMSLWVVYSILICPISCNGATPSSATPPLHSPPPTPLLHYTHRPVLWSCWRTNFRPSPWSDRQFDRRLKGNPLLPSKLCIPNKSSRYEVWYKVFYRRYFAYIYLERQWLVSNILKYINWYECKYNFIEEYLWEKVR